MLGNTVQEKKVIHKKLCRRGFSLLFLEVPLSGRAGFDLHIVQDAENIKKQTPYERDLYDGYGELLSWYAGEPSCGDGLDMVYDLRESLAAPPMVYLKMSDDTPNFSGFFCKAGDAESASRYGQKSKAASGWMGSLVHGRTYRETGKTAPHRLRLAQPGEVALYQRYASSGS